MALESPIVKTEQFNALEREVWYWKRVAAELAHSLNSTANELNEIIVSALGEDCAWPEEAKGFVLELESNNLCSLREECNSVLHGISEGSWTLSQTEADEEIAGYLPSVPEIAIAISEYEASDRELEAEVAEDD